MSKVSLITPSFNSGNYFLETFKSVINQTYKDFEWIIVDDCSTDGSYELIKKTIKGYNNILLLKTDSNGGSAKARNLGLKKATGKYITFLDADDLLDPTYLEEQVKYIEDNGPLISCGYRRMTSKTTTDYYVPEINTYESVLKICPFSCLTTMYDREVIGDVFFPEDLEKVEDYPFWLNILKKGIVGKGNSKVLATYRILDNSKSRNKFKLIKYYYNVYHKSQGFNWLISCFMIVRWAFNGIKKYKNVK